ncbi:capsule assembly Wzi family protein [bacterium]|nr:capsule assembly Wzi family protein [bacterium]
MNRAQSKFAILLILMLVPISAFSQSFPQDLDYSLRTTPLLDTGRMWEVNSLFHPFYLDSRLQDVAGLTPRSPYNWLEEYVYGYAEYDRLLRESSENGFAGMWTIVGGAAGEMGSAARYDHIAAQPQIFLDARFHRHWFLKFQLRMTNEVESLEHYTGRARDIARAGLNTAEVDQATFGYNNDWVQFEFGRGREIWGPFTSTNLMPSGSAPSYERGAIQFRYKRFRYRFFFSQLEAVQDENLDTWQRYFSGRCLEYANGKNLVFGFGEISTFSGIDRPLDISYMNPFTLHLEVDQNRRSNAPNEDFNNAIWFFHYDWLALENLRISGSLIMDEFQLDEEARNRGKTDSMGYLSRLAWTPYQGKVGLTLIGEYVRVNTYTYQHDYGFNNFVHRGELLGHPIGNDADRIRVGLRTVLEMPVMIELYGGRQRHGENSLLNSPYQKIDDFVAVEFPSGDVAETYFVSFALDTRPLKHLNIGIEGVVDLKTSGVNAGMERYQLTARYVFPFLLGVD